MIDLRDMELLAALARHEHFARAAEACGISQPAFSSRIRNLEASLGIPLVTRGNRFMGFTSEGKIVLKWAHTLLADADGMRQEIEATKGELSGRLRIGAVPTALAFVADLPMKLRALHPDLTVNILSTSSVLIARGLDDFSLDAGITYLDKDLPPVLCTFPLYEERYVLVVPPEIAPRESGEASWAEAASLPLCLLSSDMRNRRIIDETFSSLDLSPDPVVETNSFTAALAQVATGAVATIVPENLVSSVPIANDAIFLALIDPVFTKNVGFAFANRDPVPPAVLALKHVLGIR